MSQESKVEALRIKLAQALNWLDVPGLDSEHLAAISNRSHHLRSKFDGVENSLICGLQTACGSLAHIQLAHEDYPIHEHVHSLKFGVSSIENALKVIAPSRIDAISTLLK
jgi:hypothetical protein